jgi:hypothetical protein
MQSDENVKKTSVKRKRVYHLLPEVRKQVPVMFDCTGREDYVAEKFGIPVGDVVAEAVRDLRRQLRRPPASEGLTVVTPRRMSA